jgi:hypothetical protein
MQHVTVLHRFSDLMRHMVTIASKVLRCKRLKHIVGPQVSLVDHQGLSVILLAILDRESSKHLGGHQGVGR